MTKKELETYKYIKEKLENEEKREKEELKRIKKKYEKGKKL